MVADIRKIETDQTFLYRVRLFFLWHMEFIHDAQQTIAYVRYRSVRLTTPGLSLDNTDSVTCLYIVTYRIHTEFLLGISMRITKLMFSNLVHV